MKNKAIHLILLSSILCGYSSFAQSRTNNKDTIFNQISIIENGLVPKILIDSAGNTYSIEERMNLYKVPGISITVFKDDKIIWSKGYGLADSTENLKVDTTTMFQAASISKAVTAFALLKLVEKKQLDIDKDVNKYLIGWKIPENDFTKTEKVTIRRLLNHTAGISVSGFIGYRKSDTIPSTIEIITGKGNTPAIVVEDIPGTRFSYSGGGYVILQKLIEDVSEMDFADFMEKEILIPLKMTNSTFNQYPKMKRSLAYNNFGKAYEGGWFILPELAPAGLWTTSTDLAKFCMAVQQSFRGAKGAYLSQKMAMEMLTPINNWGLGVGIRGDGEDAFYFHGGKNPGFNSIIIDLFNKNLGIALMTNGEQGGTLRDEIVRSFAQYYNIKIQPPPRIVKTVPIDRNYINEFLGKYQWKENYFLELSIDKNNNLILTDLFDGKLNTFVQTENFMFIDKNNGEEAVLNKNSDTGTLSIFYNNIDTFIKVK
jgi:CubicO group peptidase (beta-lactamase class C family)